MVDWHQFAEHASFYWQEFLEWFLSIPMYGQALVIVGAVAVVALAGILVYYVLKGVAYLIYYILKGVYYLLKAIFMGIYKIFEELYYAISGKPKPIKEESKKEEEVAQVIEPKIISQIKDSAPSEYDLVQPNATYCSECGSEFSAHMKEKLSANGSVFCIHCGKGFKVERIEVEQ
ncbi:MAG: hypothetical protein EU533_00680 [Promethearchaeota archaeon]|nr:MAG: hypothetical protein EU533_00680 [Candidatus Lokiarchaeota archaeon]